MYLFTFGTAQIFQNQTTLNFLNVSTLFPNRRHITDLSICFTNCYFKDNFGSLCTAKTFSNESKGTLILQNAITVH